jgi:hypothetical protein
MAMFRACAALVLVAAGCAPPMQGASVHAGTPLDPGRVAEAGPLLLGESQPIEPGRFTGALHGKLPAFRVESFGGTVLDIDLWGTGAVLFVQGPLPGPDGDDLGPAPVVAESGARYELGAHLTGVRLDAPGVYRVVVADRTALDSGGPLLHPFTLSATCTSGVACERAVLKSWHEGFSPGGSVYPYITVEEQFGVSTRLWRQPRGRLLHAEIMAAMERPKTRGTFPLFPLGNPILSEYLNLSDLEVATPPPQHITGELFDLLGACDLPRPHPTPVTGAYTSGNFPDLSLTRCQVSNSVRLASILNSLAYTNYGVDGEGSWVAYLGQRHATPPALVHALMDAGHRIELIDERSHVQTTTLLVDGKEVFWPIWVDTGLILEEGGTRLRMPVGRSRVVWRISGPDVNARVALAIRNGGLQFVPELDRPPGWVGRRVAALSTDPAAVVESFRAAAHYVPRDRDRRSNANLSLGTSSDAAAAVRRWVWGDPDASLPFPLLRFRRADDELMDSMPTSPIERRMLDLPHDHDDWNVAGWPTDRWTNRDAARRLYNMSPFAVDSPMLDLFPPTARRGLCLLERSAGHIPSPGCRSITNVRDVR